MYCRRLQTLAANNQSCPHSPCKTLAKSTDLKPLNCLPMHTSTKSFTKGSPGWYPSFARPVDATSMSRRRQAHSTALFQMPAAVVACGREPGLPDPCVVHEPHTHAHARAHTRPPADPPFRRRARFLGSASFSSAEHAATNSFIKSSRDRLRASPGLWAW
jgi:hypothetical protein